VADLFLTPTAALADVVLPAASYLEYDAIIAPPYYPVVQVQQKVARVGESRSDAAIIRGLAERLGLGEFFWESEEEGLDFILKPAGLRFQEFRQIGVLSGRRSFRHYEKQGFATPSGKVELFSNRLRDWGFDPLPVYRPLPETPDGSPDLAREYPLVLTSWKVGAFRHSGGRQIESLRQSQAEPVVWIHPETAGRLGIAEGDRTVIETARGRITQRASLTDKIDPRVVGVDYAWWFPERGVDSLFDWDQANVNVLTDDRNPSGSEMGTPLLRGFLCRVYKVDLDSA
jgi:anaerobic selenocysteine-containing dehydrogenase